MYGVGMYVGRASLGVSGALAAFRLHASCFHAFRAFHAFLDLFFAACEGSEDYVCLAVHMY